MLRTPRACLVLEPVTKTSPLWLVRRYKETARRSQRGRALTRTPSRGPLSPFLIVPFPPMRKLNELQGSLHRIEGYAS